MTAFAGIAMTVAAGAGLDLCCAHRRSTPL